MKKIQTNAAGVKPAFEIATVTPEQAAEWLREYNAGNRPMAEARVAALADEIRLDRWHLSNDALAFAPDGTLTNGQHRLAAVQLAGKPAQFLVVRGLPLAARDIMDRGRARTVADMLHFNYGFVQAKDIAAICGTLDYVTGNSYQRQITVQRVLELREQYAAPLAWVLANMGRHRPFFTHSSVLAAVVVGLANPKFAGEVKRFHAALLSGLNIPAEQGAVLRLRDWGTERGGGKANRVGTFYRTCNAIMYYIAEDSTRSITDKKTGYEFLTQVA